MKHHDPRLFRLPYDPTRSSRKARARKRYAPEGWPHGPIWSDDDVERAREFRRAHTGKNGNVLWIDRRKEWQKKLRSCSVGPDGTVKMHGKGWEPKRDYP